MGLIITGDDLFSHQPMIETVLENNFKYIFVAKKPSHTFMMNWIETYSSLNEIQTIDEEGRTVIYQWVNDVPLSARKDTVKVNFFCKKTITLDALGQQQHCRTESWITSIEITAKCVKELVRGAKTRWKIENECFNTLKNQGYHLTHNYGHGEKHLAFNFYQLTLLAFTLQQVAELCDKAYQACRKMAGSKRSLWEKLRTLIHFLIFDSMEQLLLYFLDCEAYDIINGYVQERNVP